MEDWLKCQINLSDLLYQHTETWSYIMMYEKSILCLHGRTYIHVYQIIKQNINVYPQGSKLLRSKLQRTYTMYSKS